MTEQGKGYGIEILRQGLNIAREHHLGKVLLTINDQNISALQIMIEGRNIGMYQIVQMKNEDIPCALEIWHSQFIKYCDYGSFPNFWIGGKKQ